MKNYKMTSLLLLLCLLFSLASCGMKEKEYADDVSTETLSETVQRKLTDTDFVRVENDYLEEYITLPSDARDFCICIATDGNNLNEFGIWRVDDDSTESLRALLRTYLDHSLERNRAFYDSYIPQETAKLRDAEVRVFGDYVVYAILNPTDRKLFFQTVENALLEHEID